MHRFAPNRLQRTWSNNSIQSDGGPPRLISPAISVTQFYKEGGDGLTQNGKVVESSPLRHAVYRVASETPSVYSDVNATSHDYESVVSQDFAPFDNDNTSTSALLAEPLISQRASSVPLGNSNHIGDSEDFDETLHTLSSYVASPSALDRDRAAKAYAHAIELMHNFSKQSNLYDNAILRITGPPPRRSQRSGTTTPFKKTFASELDDDEDAENGEENDTKLNGSEPRRRRQWKPEQLPQRQTTPLPQPLPQSPQKPRRGRPPKKVQMQNVLHKTNSRLPAVTRSSTVSKGPKRKRKARVNGVVAPTKNDEREYRTRSRAS